MGDLIYTGARTLAGCVPVLIVWTVWVQGRASEICEHFDVSPDLWPIGPMGAAPPLGGWSWIALSSEDGFDWEASWRGRSWAVTAMDLPLAILGLLLLAGMSPLAAVLGGAQ